ncbi:MAG: ATP-binding protein [Dehalococcoidia bacterium]|nr:ATP-binding protein [Dehalococcoidia bacterium]
MSLYLILPLLQGCLSGILAIMVVWMSRRSPANSLFAAFLFSLTLWGFLIFGMRVSADLGRAIWWERGALVFIVATPVLFYHFALRYSNAGVSSLWLFGMYLYLAVVISLSPTGLIVEGMTIDMYGNAPVWGPLFAPLIIPGYLLMFLAVYHLRSAHKAATSYEDRNRLVYFVVGGSAAIAGGVVDVLPALGLNIYPGTIIGNLAFCLLTSFAILKYHLFDIQVATHKVAPYAVMGALVAGPYLGIYFALYHFWQNDRAPVWLHLVFVAAIVVGIPLLWGRVQDWTNRFFYRDRYEHLQALERLQEEAQSIIDPSSITSAYPVLIRQAMQSSHVCLMTLSHSRGELNLTSSVGFDSQDAQISLSKKCPLVEILEGEQGLLHREDVEANAKLQAMTMREKEAVERLDGEMYISLKSSGRQVGLLVMGARIDHQPYSWEDERLMKRIAGQMALNIENIHLYQASLERERQLSALSCVNKAINSSLDIQSTYEVFASELKKVIPVDLACVVMIEGDVQRFYALSTELEASWQKPGTELPMRGTATEWIAMNKMPIIKNDLAKQKRFPTEESYLKHGIRSLINLPLISQGEVTGTFIVGSFTPDVYGEREVSFLEQAASQLSLSMQNSRLYARERGERARLELLNEQREEFFRAISHELKTPLTAIKSSGELLSEELAGETQVPLKRLIDNIRRSTDRLEVMLNDLLDMAKARAMPLELHVEPVDVRASIGRAVDLCSPPIRQRYQKLTVDVSENIPQVMADQKRFEYMITNLLGNANKYTPEGGKIKLSAWVEDTKVKIAVQDTGQGIPDEEKDLIFEPFYRGKFSGERIKGIGVGLATVKQVVKLHGGTVQVQSKVGEGSTFTISLPLP